MDERYWSLLTRDREGTKNDFPAPDFSVLMNNLKSSGELSIPEVVVELNNQQSELDLTKSDINDEGVKYGIPEVQYEELTLATNNWDESNKLGRGGFGTVFRGYWKNTFVAIKRIEPRDRKSASSDEYKAELKQSLNELRHLNACRHDNILGLYGYCLTGERPCLVYQLMPNGTLEQHLFLPGTHGPSQNQVNRRLQWNQKYYIALGTARGLQFLHTFKAKPLIHGDIKPANILLDSCLQPKIGDFGLARESPSQKPVEISKVYGTRPYLPPEFVQTRCLSTKIDTYSFGIVLYEIASGKRVYDSKRKPEHLIELMNWMFEGKVQYQYVIDGDITLAGSQIDQPAVQIFSLLTQIGKECTALNPNVRPEMASVLKWLEGRT